MGLMQTIREQAKGWLAWIVFIIICIPFALFGVQQYFYGSGGSTTVASVNGTDISLSRFQDTYQRQRQRLERMLGSNFDINSLNAQQLKMETLNSLIDEELVLQAAHGSGMRVPDKLLAEAIRQQPAFHGKDGFSQQQYEQVLQTQGYTASAFEHQFRRSLLLNQVFAGIARSAFVTKAEVDNVLRLLHETRTFSALTVPAARFPDVPVSDAEIKSYYEQHKSDFVTPEEVKLAYLELSRKAVEANINPDEKKLHSYYEAHQARYTVPEERRASQILIKLGKGATKAEVEKATEKLDAIKKQIEAGASFAALAKQDSQDPGSAKKGGDLGYSARGSMPKALDQAVFSLSKVGQIAGPVRTQFGLHLVELTGIKPAHTESFAEARAAVLRDYRKDNSQKVYYDDSERLANLTFENPDSLEPAAKALGLKVQETGYVPRGGGTGSGIASDSKVIHAAFSSDVLEQGDNSKPIELSDDRAVVIRVLDHKARQQRSLQEAHADIVAALRTRKSEEKAEQLGHQLLERLRKGEDATAVAKSEQLNWKDYQSVGRGDSAVPRQIEEAVFRLSRPGKGKATYSGLELSNGNYAVLALHSVTPGDPTKIAQKEREAVRQNLEQAYGRSEYEDYVARLREEAKIEIHKKNL